MGKHFIKKLTLFSTLSMLFLSANDKFEQSWPMSGGPQGNWQVTTDQDVPTEWSVRTGKNIKWRTELPEGGQSGIAVWGDKLFLTINPELDTPAFAQIKTQLGLAQKAYDTYKSNVVNTLKDDSTYIEMSKALNNSLKTWNDFFTKRSKKMPANQIERSRKRLLSSTDEGKHLKKAEHNLRVFIHNSDKKLKSLDAELSKYLRLFKTTGASADIVLVCLDSNKGEILWKKTIKGLMSSGYHYGFSDSTTPCPATDGTYVWANNSSGGMACFDFEGKEIWSRTWMPTGGRPFNKQFDSILSGDSLLNVEPPDKDDTSRDQGWNYLRAIDKNTGKTQWVCKDAITHYNAPVLGQMADGTPSVLIGRGGPHGVPERPVGLSMINLQKDKAGEILWRWEPKDDNKTSGNGALSTQHWDKEKAYWFNGSAQLSHISVDSTNGKQINELPLNTMDRYLYDKESKQYKTEPQFEIRRQDQSRHCNIIVDDHLFYLMRYSPFVVRHNTKSGKTETLELPTELIRGKDKEDQWLYQTKETNDGLNSKGQRHAGDSRTRGDGFQKCFLGSPTAVNGKVYFTSALGLTYVLDANAAIFNEKALIAVNDLGERGKTWTVGSLTYANGKIYHRDLKAVVCVE
ncbi:PQQ-binding-like beta-propeller repeat protein [Lentisphaera profundi]|uniref:PQQ-binding-like beta-propeller repeat protein n=1 Tax=Lentisphaera profundi TaxID=1658616 RepID=A0ABY7VYA8_9BACT|nr:PQQ-binding-like beta-propeller repeat protein [Lentisphaera profundi]WDE98779.1 PQQ-binding-like beta-propeller repeat protein [Lentisphaera profundi]